MIGDMIMGFASMVWYCFGPFMLLALAVGVMTKQRLDIAGMFKTVLGLITDGVCLINDCCRAIADGVAANLAVQYRGIAANVLYAILLCGIFGTFCFLCRSLRNGC